MQISPAISSLASPLTGAPTGLETRGKSTQAGNRESAALRAESTPVPTVASDASDSVSVSAQAQTQTQTQEAGNAPAPIYAEIWKGGVKLAQVDIHGHVTSLSGLVTSGGGGSVAGALLAAQRAVQVAQQVGGEIRSAGQPLDRQTLLMRARLANTYGS